MIYLDIEMDKEDGISAAKRIRAMIKRSYYLCYKPRKSYAGVF